MSKNCVKYPMLEASQAHMVRSRISYNDMFIISVPLTDLGKRFMNSGITEFIDEDVASSLGKKLAYRLTPFWKGKDKTYVSQNIMVDNITTNDKITDLKIYISDVKYIDVSLEPLMLEIIKQVFDETFVTVACDKEGE